MYVCKEILFPCCIQGPATLAFWEKFRVTTWNYDLKVPRYTGSRYHFTIDFLGIFPNLVLSENHLMIHSVLCFSGQAINH